MIIFLLLAFTTATLWIFYKGINQIVFRKKKSALKKILFVSDISIFIILLLFLTYYYFQIRSAPDYFLFTKVFYSVTLLFLVFIPKLSFSIFYVINYLIVLLIQLFNRKKKKDFAFFKYVGLLLFLIIFFAMLYGILIGKTDLYIRKSGITSEKLPASFNKLKIVQISDIHIGSFCQNQSFINKAVAEINELKPDIVLLTGDLVNNFADEANGFDSIFNKIKAPLGKYAVLGNHDFGDYTVWRTPNTKNVNLNDVMFHYKKMGFTLLRNENIYIKKGNDSIAIAGVDSWGKPPFKQYGDVKKAMQTIPENTFTILLSHDPSYWDCVIKYLSKVDITFSGHTHGMQLGIEKFGLKYSPVQYRYPQWGGLYCYKNKYVYVNRGMGFIGFTGRIGMPPEITYFEITKK